MPDTSWEWNEQREVAAVLVAEDRLSDEQIAAEVGIDRRTLTRWRGVPAFMARVDRLIEEFRGEVDRYAIAQVGRRVAALQDRWRRLHLVIEERAGHEEMQGVAGGTSGLLVRDVKQIGRGETATVEEVFRVDTGLLREMREMEEQAARELGQRSVKHDHTGAVEHQHTVSLIPLDEFQQLPPAERHRLYREALRAIAAAPAAPGAAASGDGALPG